MVKKVEKCIIIPKSWKQWFLNEKFWSEDYILPTASRKVVLLSERLVLHARWSKSVDFEKLPHCKLGCRSRNQGPNATGSIGFGLRLVLLWRWLPGNSKRSALANWVVELPGALPRDICVIQTRTLTFIDTSDLVDGKVSCAVQLWALVSVQMLSERKGAGVVIEPMSERLCVHLSLVLDEVTLSGPTKLEPAGTTVGVQVCFVLRLSDAWAAHTVTTLMNVSVRSFEPWICHTAQVALQMYR